MYKYTKHLNYPINISKKDLKMAKYITSQIGGAQSELAATLRYFFQKFGMIDDKGRALLNDIATEELGHLEMVSTMVKELTKNATIEELESVDLLGYFTEHNKGIFPTDAEGVPFNAAYFSVTKDPIADLFEDMSAEQKARSVYENLIDIALALNNKEVIGPLLFLRQREIVHFNRFKELYEYYKEKGY